MEPKSFLDAAAQVGKYMLALPMLTKGENALKVLSPDTQFALVGEFYQVAADVTRVRFFDETSQDYFTGYIAITPDKLQIYRDGNLLAEEPITSVKAIYGLNKTDKKLGFTGVDWDSGGLGFEFDYTGCTIVTTGKKFLLRQASPIMNVPFESKAYGVNGGFDQLLDQIDSRGGYVVRAKKSSIILFFILFFGVILGCLYLVFFFKK